MKKLILGLVLFLLLLSCIGIIPALMNYGKRQPAGSALNTGQHAEKSAKKPKRPAGLDISEGMQANRKQFIEKQMASGLWVKTEISGTLPKVWITPAFLTLDEATQNQLLEVAYTYWMGELDDFGQVSDYIWDPLVLKIDNGTPLGRQVGTYEPFNGFNPGS